MALSERQSTQTISDLLAKGVSDRKPDLMGDQIHMTEGNQHFALRGVARNQKWSEGKLTPDQRHCQEKWVTEVKNEEADGENQP